jgi:hypothetical protein
MYMISTDCSAVQRCMPGGCNREKIDGARGGNVLRLPRVPSLKGMAVIMDSE